jgi:phosphoribosylformylglycinamidine synthase
MVELDDAIRRDALLFGEGAGRMIVSCAEKDVELLLTIAKSFGCPAKKIGRVGGTRIIINDLINIDAKEIFELWNNGLEKRV